MKLLNWNPRGLENPWGIRVLHDLTRREDPDVLFLQETKLPRKKLEGIKWWLGFENCFSVDYESRGRGLSLMWHNHINHTIMHFSKSHIQAFVQIEGLISWMFTGPYGNLETVNRWETWDLLWTLKPNDGCPWVVGGDFNELISNMEKRGGNPRSKSQL